MNKLELLLNNVGVELIAISSLNTNKPMLDLDHPQTPHIMEASGLLDQLLLFGQAMSISSSAQRMELALRARLVFERLIVLNKEHFENSPFITESLKEYAHALVYLRDMGQGQLNEGDGIHCPACQSEITRLELETTLTSYFERTKGIEKTDYNLSEKLQIQPDELKITVLRYCSRCTEITVPARTKLGSFEGFGTIAI